MKRIVAISCFGIIGMLGITCLLAMNNSNENAEKITTAIEEIEPNKNETKETIIDDTNTKQLEEIQKQLKEIQEKEPVVVEKEVIKEVIVEKEIEPKKSASESERKQNQIEINDGICTPSTVLRCEVCEKTGTELKVWYDSNNVKHYTCTTRCTEALGVLYGE
jgi:hypothetical protein